MRLLVLRHGRTALNDKGYFNGQYDEPLNDEGRAQALVAREKLSGAKISALYCSPLSRTRETCEIALGARGLATTFEPRLMERSLGSLDGRDVSMSGFEYGRMFDLDYDIDLPGGYESWPVFFARVGDFLDEMINRHLSDDSVLLVTHAGTARAIYYHFFPLPADRNILEPKMHNCEIAEYLIRPLPGGSYDVEYRGIWGRNV